MKKGREIVIIGNGVAGNSAAAAIREKDKDARVFLASASIHPEYSACVLSEYISGDISRPQVFLKNHQDYERDRIKTVLGQAVRKIDAPNNKVYFDSGALAYERLIIATGSRPLLPKIEGAEKQGVLAFKTLEDADRIAAYPARIAAVVGAGPIGVETSIALKKKGLKVYLIEKKPWILPRLFDKDLADRVEEFLIQADIEVLKEAEVQRIYGKDKVQGVRINDRDLECHLVIMAVGTRPETDLARKAKIKIGALSGILTDDRMRTNIEGIYAAGDCVQTTDPVTGQAGLTALWPDARRQGQVAGYNCVGVAKKFSRLLNFNRIEVFGNLALSVGYSRSSLNQDNGMDIINGEWGKGLYRIFLAGGRVLGGQFIQPSNNIGPLVNWVWKGGSASQIGETMGNRAAIKLNPWPVASRLYFGGLSK